MLKPERYVIHIYRRNGFGREARVAGLLEKIGNGSQQAFSSRSELWALLNEPAKPARATPGRKSKSERKASR